MIVWLRLVTVTKALKIEQIRQDHHFINTDMNYCCTRPWVESGKFAFFEAKMLVHVGSQDWGLGTPSRYLARTISWNACKRDYYLKPSSPMCFYRSTWDLVVRNTSMAWVFKINSEARSRGMVCEQGLGDHAWVCNALWVSVSAI